MKSKPLTSEAGISINNFPSPKTKVTIVKGFPLKIKESAIGGERIESKKI